MSRVGNVPITIPTGVKVAIEDSVVTVSGPKGTLTQEIRPEVTVTLKDDIALVARIDESKEAKSYHGLYRALIDNMVVGVSNGFSKSLLINGVGYRVEQQGPSLIFNLGYSNPIEYPLDEDLSAVIEGNNKITISGASKEKVGQTCAEIRSLRPPERVPPRETRPPRSQPRNTSRSARAASAIAAEQCRRWRRC